MSETVTINPCPRCAELEAEVARLKDELAAWKADAERLGDAVEFGRVSCLAQVRHESGNEHFLCADCEKAQSQRYPIKRGCVYRSTLAAHEARLKADKEQAE